MLEILQYPDSRLRVKALPVNNVKDSKIQKIIDEMFETMYNSPNCAGLSTTQLNIKDPKRISVINVSPDNKQSFCLINPVITHHEGESEYLEGCMSIYPDQIRAEIKRPDKITFKALDRDGNPIQMATQGILARCVQHEIDHLNGILFIDHLSLLKRKMIEKKIAKLCRN
jgi:peptide deformylase